MQKGAATQVKTLGTRLVNDHSKSLNESMALARKLGVTPPSKPLPSMLWQLQAVRQFSGQQFDLQYAKLEVLDHQQDIKEAKDEVRDGTNPQVGAAARKGAADAADAPRARAEGQLRREQLPLTGEVAESPPPRPV